ncbi:hypothetical protein [Halorubrum salipaludis]|uniref:hypothetical protein n=1 Tax=Halorubrum salipaludis TaxID=2032630 RepID=UPI0011818253|nr:hypothetical protein [Halorubrum salipaludis]
MEWEQQEAYLKIHNLFYSAVHGEVDQGLVDYGYRVPGEFTIAENRKKGVRCQPPFTLYDNNNLIFVDIVKPGRITADTVTRLSKYNNLDRESVENYLDRCDLSSSGYSKNELDNFDSCYVMSKRQYESHLSGGPELQERLDDLKTEGSIITASPGGKLIKENGGIHDSKIDQILSQGISIPNRTGKFVHLPRTVYPESLTVAICEEIVAGSDLSETGIKLRGSTVGDHFGREIETDLGHRVLEYLRKINACRVKQGESEYTFTKYNLDVVLSIRKRLATDPIEETLSDDVGGSSSQDMSLSDFTSSN